MVEDAAEESPLEGDLLEMYGDEPALPVTCVLEVLYQSFVSSYSTFGKWPPERKQ